MQVVARLGALLGPTLGGALADAAGLRHVIWTLVSQCCHDWLVVDLLLWHLQICTVP